MFRTIVVRRRLRQQIDNVIAAGMLRPDQVDAIRRRSPGERPKFWEVCVNDTADGAGWEDMSVSPRYILSFLIIGIS
jgi:hypothetical protein